MRVVARITLLLLIVGSAPASAQSKVGTTIAQFLGIEPGARSAAMGNAGAAVAEGIQAVYYNSGVIGALDLPAVQFTHSLWFADIGYNYAAATLPIRGWGTFFGSVTALNSGEIDVRTVEHPLGTGERYTVSNVAVGLGYGRQITSRFAAGIQVNYINERIWHSSHNTFTFNTGTIYQLTEGGMNLGFSLSNLGVRSRFSGRDLAIQYDNDPDTHGDNSALPGEQFTDRFPVPLMFRFGISIPYEFSEKSRLLFLLDALHPNDNTESVNTGIEWTLNDMLALRAGYQTLFQVDTELGLTLGFGLRGGIGNNHFRFDYAWADHEHLETTHRFTLVVEFD